jgi:hypothetical protein
MSVDKLIITKEDANYSIILNVISQNLTDAEALGLYVYLLSLPPKWEFYKEVIRKHFGWGRDKLEKKLTILRTHNLIEPIPERNEKGQFIGWNLHVKNGRDFTHYPENQNPENHTTENPGSGELSTGLSKNSTQNTENAAAVKPVTGFSTPIKEIDKKEIDYKNKSFCAVAQKKRNPTTSANTATMETPPKSKADHRLDNAKRHDFADSKDQLAREAAHIAEHEQRKRAPMPPEMKAQIEALRRSVMMR